MKASQSQVSPMMQKLSTYIAGAVSKPLPEEVTARAKLHLVDILAAMISGSRLAPGKRAKAYVKAQGGRPEACVIGTDIVTSAPNAALANGMFAHADETDDVHQPSRTHPGAGIVPAALAIGERNRLSGTSVLRAMVLGYDVCTRMLLAFDQAAFRYSGHQSTSFGQIFGAAAAAGALLGFDACKVRFLLSLTGQQASGLYTMLRDTEHIEKAFGMGGMTAHNGTATALMVAYGFTGVHDVFSGERDYFHTFAPRGDRAQLVLGLGRKYEILRAGIKRWAVGAPIQGPLHVLNSLLQDHKFNAGDVEKLVARLPEKELEIVNNRQMPDICVQHVLALMLLDGAVTFKSAHDYARMKDPAVLAIRKRLKMVGDPELTDALRRWRCIMEINLKDGRKLSAQTMAAKGSFVDPLSREEEEEKALDLTGPVLGKRRAEELMTALWNFERIKDVRSLRRLVSN